MLNKLLMTCFVLTLSVGANSSPTSVDCTSSFGNILKNEPATTQKLCSHSANENTAPMNNAFPYSANANHEVMIQLNADTSKSTLAEPVTVVLFIPGLLILLFMRLAKSNK